MSPGRVRRQYMYGVVLGLMLTVLMSLGEPTLDEQARVAQDVLMFVAALLTVLFATLTIIVTGERIADLSAGNTDAFRQILDSYVNAFGATLVAAVAAIAFRAYAAVSCAAAAWGYIGFSIVLGLAATAALLSWAIVLGVRELAGAPMRSSPK